MSRPEIPPAIVALGDQRHAEINSSLDRIVDEFREHTTRHDPGDRCPFAATALGLAVVPAPVLAELVAAAVERLARAER